MAKRKNVVAEREKKAQIWLERTMRLSGFDETVTRRLLGLHRTQSFRVTSLTGVSTESTLKALHSLKIVPEVIEWANGAEDGVWGFTCSPEGISQLNESELVTQGTVYIQNAASWLPVIALSPQADEMILDVCAAPGGKASHLQAMTNNASKLTCNDNSKPRLLKLQRNMERLGAHASYTLADTTRLSRKFAPESFDKILLDAPCSGEGMMTLSDVKLFDSWSVAHIRRLSELQKKILSESWKLLKPGGTLVYSTCTMAPEENESVVDHLLRKNPDAQLVPLNFDFENCIPALSSWNDREYASDLSPCLRLMPGKLTEAFFVAKIIKSLDSPSK